MCTPVQDNHKLWKGSFDSITYGSSTVSGDIDVIFRDPLSTDDNYSTVAFLSYKGSYCYGGRVKLGVAVSSSGSTTMKVPHIKAQLGNQTIDYNVTNINGDVIEGEYISHNPHDSGKFILRATDDKHYNSSVKTSGCTIL